ncbi:hypothetical protein SAMN05421770_105120 [Granulicella rosea]|uniref:Uncharacterized protein n=1 Tax=Granulicella rosea TaxID=474952 RepID=A0A239KP43_9BACT|nr:hypothetical protein [Granulicella rosea]SNT20147.1 hypothetical protein SAMN05421770_105120 [Granulicella rosea]
MTSNAKTVQYSRVPDMPETGTTRREIRFVIVGTILLVAGVLGGILWRVLAPDSDNMDKTAAAHIVRLCNQRVDCRVQAGDLFDGDWDTLYVIGSQVSQKGINAALGTYFLRSRDNTRIFALVKDGKIVQSQHLAYGADAPLDGELEFEEEHNREQRIARYDRNTWLQITVYPNQNGGGIFYVLTEKAHELN